MTRSYDNITKEATPAPDQDTPQFSMWAKVASTTGADYKPQLVTLPDVVELITGPKLQAVTEKYQLRLAKEGKTPNLKGWAASRLPGILPGHYNGKGADYLTQYSPWVVGDIDGIKDEAELVFIFEELAALPYVALVYVSKSGQGLRFFVPTDGSQDTHEADELAVLQDVAAKLNLPIDEGKDGPHLDTDNNGKHVPWILNYSPPNLTHYNPQAEVFKSPGKVATKPKKDNRRKAVNGTSTPSAFGKREFTDEEYQFITEYLISQIERDGKDITAGMSRDEWVSLAASLATKFGEVSGFEYFDRLSRNWSDGKKTYNEAEARKLIKEQARRRVGNIGTFFNVCKTHGYLFADAIKDKLRQEQATTQPAPKPEPVEEPAPAGGEEFFQFYEEYKGEPRIKHRLLVDLLKMLGFYRYDRDGEFFIVHIKDNVVRECSRPEVIDAVDNYLDQQPEELPDRIQREELRNKIYAGLASFFSNDILGRLRPYKPIEFQQHTKDTAFFYFRNGFVEVSRAGVQLRPYSELKKCVWENQILRRDFKPVPPHKYKDFSFYQFARNVANCWDIHPHYKRKNELNDPLRFTALQTVIGYLLHAFFERELKSVIFTDSRIGEDDEANGRSGKTLLLKALGHILNRDFKKSKTYVEINGKDFDTGKSFKYQELGLDTVLVHLNDVKRNFKFEDLFNDITEGIRRERKNESPSIVLAKMAISTNRTVKLSGASAKGRAIEVELGEYYDENFTPKMEFNQWFFAEWTPAEWSCFDAFMMDCVRAYFAKGVQTPATINLNDRKKVEETSIEFAEWMEGKDQVFVAGERFDLSDLKENFVDMYPDYQKNSWFTQTRFNKWIKLYCGYDQSYTSISRSSSNGRYYVTFERK